MSAARSAPREPTPERGVIIASLPPGTDGDEGLAEMRELLRTATVDAVAALTQHRRRPDPRTYLGPGKIDELRELLRDAEAEVVVCDDELTPRQQRALEDALQRIGHVSPKMLLPAVYGPAWGYRTRARLSVRHVVKKGGVLVGFHERKSSYVADMRECHVLPPSISALLVPLRELIGSLTIRDRLPQIELAIGARADDPSTELAVLVLRVIEEPTPEDLAKLDAFADAHGVSLWLQPGGPGSATPMRRGEPGLVYAIPEFDVVMPFSPTEFTQVNPHINEVLVRRAIALLDPRPGDRAADFFCGLGNFTLPIARRGASVVGIEGSEPTVRRARENAAFNRLASSTRFEAANLFAATPESIAPLLPLDKVLIDPPREGAIELVKSLPPAIDERAPRRIVYVSCNPATLARDAEVLVHERGYTLAAAGVVNMFPHTAHVESIALFTREG